MQGDSTCNTLSSTTLFIFSLCSMFSLHFSLIKLWLCSEMFFIILSWINGIITLVLVLLSSNVSIPVTALLLLLLVLLLDSLFWCMSSASDISSSSVITFIIPPGLLPYKSYIDWVLDNRLGVIESCSWKLLESELLTILIGFVEEKLYSSNCRWRSSQRIWRCSLTKII